MIFPLVLSIAGDRPAISRSKRAARAPAPVTTFLRITLPLSLPGIFAAIIFGFVGCFGESAVPIIMGGVGYELVGNTITSSMDVLNYPLAAALSSIVVVLMLLLMIGWYLVFDMRDLSRQDPRVESVMERRHPAGALLADVAAHRGSCLLFLYVPLVPPLLLSVQGDDAGDWTLALVWRALAHPADRRQSLRTTTARRR